VSPPEAQIVFKRKKMMLQLKVGPKLSLSETLDQHCILEPNTGLAFFFLSNVRPQVKRVPVLMKERGHMLSKKSEKARKTSLIASPVQCGLLFPL
jgi:hypothetical protein